MMKECEKFGKFNGEIKINESYLGAKRIRGKRGRGANGKTSEAVPCSGRFLTKRSIASK